MSEKQPWDGHTPTPWAISGLSMHAIGQEGRSDLSNIAVCVRRGDRTGEEADANAAFIVHAVNSHSQFVEALKGLADAYEALKLDAAYYAPGSWYSHARAALSKARGGAQ